MERALLVAAIAIFGGGCNDGPGDDDDEEAARDAGVDAATADAGETRDSGPDAEVDSGVPASCDEPFDGTFALDPDGDDTQIYASAAFDGTGVWVAFCKPELGDTGLFDVFVTRVGCDGVATHVPVAVSGAGNDVAPSLALAGDRILVAWSRDSGVFPDNMDVVTRVLTIDGDLVGDAEAALETTRGGASVGGNAMSPDVAARPEGGFWLAGLRADDEGTSFQAFAQALDADGALDGEAIDAALEPGVGQGSPAIAVAADGRAWVAWQRADEEGVETTWVRPLDGEAVQAFPEAELTAGPALAADPTDPARVWLSVAADLGIREDLALADVGGSAHETFGDARDAEIWATPVPGANGVGAVVWLWRIQGIQAGVGARRFSTAGDGTITLGEAAIVADDEPAGPYPLGAARVSDDVVLVVWSDGQSPAFRLRGRFVRLPSGT